MAVGRSCAQPIGFDQLALVKHISAGVVSNRLHRDVVALVVEHEGDVHTALGGRPIKGRYQRGHDGPALVMKTAGPRPREGESDQRHRPGSTAQIPPSRPDRLSQPLRNPCRFTQPRIGADEPDVSVAGAFRNPRDPARVRPLGRQFHGHAEPVASRRQSTRLEEGPPRRRDVRLSRRRHEHGIAGQPRQITVDDEQVSRHEFSCEPACLERASNSTAIARHVSRSEGVPSRSDYEPDSEPPLRPRDGTRLVSGLRYWRLDGGAWPLRGHGVRFCRTPARQ